MATNIEKITSLFQRGLEAISGLIPDFVYIILNWIGRWVKKIASYLRNIILWFAPFFIFAIALFLFVRFLKGNLDSYIQLLKVLVWPVTVLMGLFFFRKVITYMFFSMDQFNFFGAKGNLKNVQELISEEVEKKVAKDKADKATRDEMKKLEKKLTSKTATAEENHKLAMEIYKIYQEYKKDSEEKIRELTSKNNQLQIEKNETDGFEGGIPQETQGEPLERRGERIINKNEGTAKNE